MPYLNLCFSSILQELLADLIQRYVEMGRPKLLLRRYVLTDVVMHLPYCNSIDGHYVILKHEATVFLFNQASYFDPNSQLYCSSLLNHFGF